MNDMAKNLLLWVIIAVVLLTVFQSFNPRSDPSTLSYSEFMQKVENNDVAEVLIRNDNRTIDAKLKDGNKLHTTALLTDKTVDRTTGQPTWKQSLEMGSAILHIITLDSDANGLVYLAVDVGREVPGSGITDEKILLLRLGSGGAPRGVLAIPPLPTADEQFRPITVGDDGVVYVMAAGDGGLAVTRYVFP